MSTKIFDHPIIHRSEDGRHPRIISPDAARGGPLGGRLLAMMIAAIILVIVASAIINYFY
jgi:hypothetical protein